MPLTPRLRMLWPCWRPGVLAWALAALFVLGMVATGWLDQLLRQAGRPESVQLTAEDATYAVLGLVSATAVGAVVASRRPAHPVGWLLLAFGLLTVVSIAATSYVGYALVARPGGLPAAGAAVVLVYSLNLAGAPVPLLALALDPEEMQFEASVGMRTRSIRSITSGGQVVGDHGNRRA